LGFFQVVRAGRLVDAVVQIDAGTGIVFDHAGGRAR